MALEQQKTLMQLRSQSTVHIQILHPTIPSLQKKIICIIDGENFVGKHKKPKGSMFRMYDSPKEQTEIR